MVDIGFGLQRISQLIVNPEIRNLSLIFTAVLCLCLLIKHRLKNARKYALAAKIPGPTPLPFIGNAHMFIGLDMIGLVTKLLEMKKQYGSPQRFWMGSEFWVGLMDPNDLEAVLTSEHAINKNSTYRFFTCQSNGLFVASGDRWRSLRKLANPTFHMKQLEMFIQVFDKQSQILVKALEPKANGILFNLQEYVARCTLDMICGTQMGVSTTEQTDNTSDFVHNLGRSTDIVLMRAHKPYLQSDFIFNRTRYHKRNQEFVKVMHWFSREVILKRMAIRSENSKLENTDNYQSVIDKKRPIYLDAILDNFSDKSAEELVYYIMDMLVAGSDTSSVAISYALLMLAMHPEVQEKVFQEQCSIYENLDSPVTYADLNEMKYLEMVVKESLRLCTVPGIVRHLTKELDIENYTLPAGTNVYLSFYSAQRDTRYWKYPDKFYPEHFVPEEIAKRPKFSYLPFSMGPRNCPGYKYGMLSMKTVLSYVLRKYKFTTPLKMEDLRYRMSFMLEPVQLYFVQMNKREHNKANEIRQ